MTHPTPVPPELREAFETDWATRHGRRPTTWTELYENSILYRGQMTEDMDGVYFAVDAREAWASYQAADKAATERERARAEQKCWEIAQAEQDAHNSQAWQAADACAVAVKGGL